MRPASADSRPEPDRRPAQVRNAADERLIMRFAERGRSIAAQLEALAAEYAQLDRQPATGGPAGEERRDWQTAAPEAARRTAIESLSGLARRLHRLDIARHVVGAAIDRLDVDVTRSAQAAGVRRLPSILFNCMPKSAGTYIRAVLAEGLHLEPSGFIRGSYPHTTIDYLHFYKFCTGDQIAQSHLSPQPPSLWYLESCRLRMILHVRDPRAVVLSWTHHVSQLRAALVDEPLYLHQFAVIRYDDAYFAKPFAAQIDDTIEHFAPIFLGWLEGWLEIEKRNVIPILVTQFEDFIRDQAAFILRILDFYEIPHGCFVDPGIEPSRNLRFRRGLSDEWREALTPAQQARISAMIPDHFYERFGWARV